MYDSDHGSEETREDIERERREREMEWEMEKRSKVVRKIMETMDCFDYLESESLKQKLNPKEYLIIYELLLNKMTDMEEEMYNKIFDISSKRNNAIDDMAEIYHTIIENYKISKKSPKVVQERDLRPRCTCKYAVQKEQCGIICQDSSPQTTKQ